MGVANTKSTGITNSDAGFPSVHNNNFLVKGPMYCAAGTAAVVAADASGSVYRFARVPSGCRVHGMRIFSDAISGATSATVGLYNIQDTAGNQGAAVSAALFATGIDLSVAQTEPYDVIFNNLGISNVEKRLWELLGLSADPMIMYDICVVGTTLSSSSGNIAMQIEFTI